jgi:hypothetical protein
VRWRLALGALTFGTIAAGVLLGSSAYFEALKNRSPGSQSDADARPALGPIADQVQRQYRRTLGESHPEDEERQRFEYWRTPRQGDFWTQDEFYRRFQKPDGYFPPANR